MSAIDIRQQAAAKVRGLGALVTGKLLRATCEPSDVDRDTLRILAHEIAEDFDRVAGELTKKPRETP